MYGFIIVSVLWDYVKSKNKVYYDLLFKAGNGRIAVEMMIQEV